MIRTHQESADIKAYSSLTHNSKSNRLLPKECVQRQREAVVLITAAGNGDHVVASVRVIGLVQTARHSPQTVRISPKWVMQIS